MISLLISPSIRSQILPKHCIPLNRLEYDSRLPSFPLTATINLISTLQKLAPSPLPGVRHPHPWELSPTTLTIRINIHHERAHAISISARTAPVIVMFVMAAYTIPLRSQPFDVEILSPALKSAGSVLDAADNVIAIEQGNFGEADCFLD
jgi:hypothetical protein